MGITFNGTDFGDHGGDITINGVSVEYVYANGVEVWERPAPAGSQDFTSSGWFYVPTGHTQVTVKMAGGGGAGGEYLGGTAGTYVSTVVGGLTGGQAIYVTIGNGGVKRNGSGGTTSFGGLATAGGGAGNNFYGSGAGRVSPYNGVTYYDGTFFGGTYHSWMGGMASAFGHGGDYKATGGTSAGGSADADGGKGRCVVSWS